MLVTSAQLLLFLTSLWDSLTFFIMGTSMSNETDATTDATDEDLYRQLMSELDKYDNYKMGIVTDAAVSSQQNEDVRLNSLELITKEQLVSLDNFEEYEQIALLFLLQDDASVGLEKMIRLVEGSGCNVLSECIPRNYMTRNEVNRILESLTIIQNYEVLKKLGYKKEDMKQRFQPTQNLSACYVNRIKKYLYRMCEDMLISDEIIRRIKKDITVPRFKYPETLLLFLDTKGYVSYPNNNIQNILKHLKGLDMEYNDLLQLSRDVPFRNDAIERRPRDLRCDKTSEQSLGDGVVQDSRTLPSVGPCYSMDRNHPGTFLLIENIRFYNEPDPNYRHLIHTASYIENRTGSQVDSARLKETFKAFGFKIIHLENQTHFDMEEQIKKVANEDVTDLDSSFFVCFLSHGIEGAVLASNNIPVEVKAIEKWVCSPQLVGRPKVLIIQSCQGNRSQTVPFSETDELTTDGPSESPKVPPTCDILQLWSTVPGYASFRSVSSGTWFIQSLCKNLLEHSDKHLTDISTHVQNEVTGRSWNQVVDGKKVEVRKMVCYFTSTLSKFLYLPEPRNF